MPDPLHRRNPTETYYVSGPMRDIPKFNFPMFDSCASWLRGQGFGVMNPADHDREIDPDCERKPGFAAGDESLNEHPEMGFQALLGWDLQQISSHACTGIVLLPGWEKSRGAAHERYVAEACGKQVWLAHYGHECRSGDGERYERWYMTLCEDRLLSSFTAEGLREALSSVSFPTGVLHDPKAMVDGEREESWRRDMQAVRDGNTYTHPAGSQDNVVGLQIGQFQTKDSGERVAFDSGMVRDTQEGKPRYDLIPLGPLQRLAELYARGAVKYGDRNWQKANSQDELERFLGSAFRHFIQFLKGDRDEDHGTAVVWNIFAALWLEEQLCAGGSVREND